MNTLKDPGLSPKNAWTLLSSFRQRLAPILALLGGLWTTETDATQNVTPTPITSSALASTVQASVRDITENPVKLSFQDEARKILEKVRARKVQRFRDTTEQDDFFQTVAALQQGVSTKDDAIFFIHHDSSRHYVSDITVPVLKKLKTTSLELTGFLINP